MKMTKYSKTTWFLLFTVAFGIATCQRKISRVSRCAHNQTEQPSNNKFKVLVREQGAHFTEEVAINMKNKSVVYNVPAHRQISQADVLSDYVSNLTVTRLPNSSVCYIRPHDADVPALKELEKSMQLVSSKKGMIKKGINFLSSMWTVKGPANLTKLRPNVLEFCRGLPIYELTRLEQDGITVLSGGHTNVKRQARQLGVRLCQPISSYDLSACPKESNWTYICRFPSSTCVYTVTCTSLTVIRANRMCTDTHSMVSVICCDLACRTPPPAPHGK